MLGLTVGFVDQKSGNPMTSTTFIKSSYPPTRLNNTFQYKQYSQIHSQYNEICDKCDIGLLDLCSAVHSVFITNEYLC